MVSLLNFTENISQCLMSFFCFYGFNLPQEKKYLFLLFALQPLLCEYAAVSNLKVLCRVVFYCLCQYSYILCHINDYVVPMVTISVDAEKTFDRAEWNHLVSVVSRFNFDSELIFYSFQTDLAGPQRIFLPLHHCGEILFV